jgi:hypothetical protein
VSQEREASKAYGVLQIIHSNNSHAVPLSSRDRNAEQRVIDGQGVGSTKHPRQRCRVADHGAGKLPTGDANVTKVMSHIT